MTALIDLTATEFATLSSAIDRVRAGDIIIVRGICQHLDYFDEIHDKLIDRIRSHAGEDVATAIRERGIQHMHEYLDGEKLFDINIAVRKPLGAAMIGFVIRFVHDTLNYSKPVYIHSQTIVRFFCPYEYTREHATTLQHAPGFTQIQGPHRDSWFDHATRGLNLWLAVGPVRAGNGLLIYPRLWGKDIPHNGLYQISRKQPLGKPINFELDPGDMIFFAGEHFHSSEVNATGETRIVLTNRFCLDRPVFSESNQIHHWIHSIAYSNPFQRHLRWLIDIPYSQLFGYLTSRILRRLRKFVGVEKVARPIDVEALEFENLREPNIRIVDNATIAVTLDGEEQLLSRYCPHEGADLAFGYIKGSNIYCAWHNAAFDWRSGKSHCAGLKNLRNRNTAATDS